MYAPPSKTQKKRNPRGREMKSMRKYTYSLFLLLIFALGGLTPGKLSADSFDKDFADFEEFETGEKAEKQPRRNAIQRFFNDAAVALDIKYELKMTGYSEEVPTDSKEEEEFKDDAPTVIEEILYYETSVERGDHRFTTSGWFEIGTQEDTYHGFTDSFDEKERRRRNHELNELYWFWDTTYFDTTLGKKVFKNGISSTFSPVDRISPVDWNDPLYPKQLGTWFASVLIPISSLNFTMAYLPVFTPSKYPSLRSRWIPPSNSIIQYWKTNTNQFSTETDYEYVYPDPSDQYFAKLELTTTIGMDVYMSYFDGYSPYPVIRTENLPGGGNKYYIEHIPITNSCAGFSFVYEEYEFHTEALVQKNNEKDEEKEEYKDDEYVSYIYGAMAVFEDVIITLDYTDETITKEKPENDYESSEELRSRMHGWIGSFTYEFTPYLNARLAMILCAEDEGDVRDFTINWEVIDRLNLSLKLQTFGGEDDSFFKEQWGHNNRAVLGVVYTFANERDI